MLKKHPFLAKNPIDRFLIQFSQFTAFFSIYIKNKIVYMSEYFEKNKNFLVRFFMMKRGRYNRPFLHISAMAVVVLGLLISPLIAGTYPVLSQESSANDTGSSAKQSIIVGDNVFSTDISRKPRDKVIIYTVQKGDTLSTISRKFGISVETIQWENDLSGDNLVVGDDLRILPVTGVAYKVVAGDTIYTIAKKLDTEPQKIVDFPFNDFANPETFSLIGGQSLMVPDGVKPSEQPTFVRPKPIFIAQQGPTSVSSAGFVWPVSGSISQFASWYHMALDITDPVGTPIVAATSGTVASVSVGSYDGGYGNNVYIDAGNGYQTHYAHMLSVSVSPGQSVTAGRTVIGYVGLSGRTTGAHLHFEIIQNGVLVNPLGFLQ